MIRCGDNETIGIVVLDELQERVQDAADLSDFVARRPISPQRVEFVEQYTARVFSISSKINRSFAAVSPQGLGDQTVQLNTEEWQRQLARQRRGRHCFPYPVRRRAGAFVGESVRVIATPRVDVAR